jgi:hypothetical protein
MGLHEALALSDMQKVAIEVLHDEPSGSELPDVSLSVDPVSITFQRYVSLPGCPPSSSSARHE